MDQDAVDQEQMARLTMAVSRVPRLSVAVIPIALGPSDFHFSVAVLEVNSTKLFFMDSNCSADHAQLVSNRVLPYLRAALLITDLALVMLPVPRQGRDLNCGPAVLRNSKTVVSAIASKQAIPQVLDYNMGVVLDETRCFLKSNLLQAQLDFSQISAGFSPTPKVPRIQGSSPVASGQMNFFFGASAVVSGKDKDAMTDDDDDGAPVQEALSSPPTSLPPVSSSSSSSSLSSTPLSSSSTSLNPPLVGEKQHAQASHGPEIGAKRA